MSMQSAEEELPVEEMLEAMATDPFLCVVICEQDIRIFSKNVTPERLAQAKRSLEQSMGGR